MALLDELKQYFALKGETLERNEIIELVGKISSKPKPLSPSDQAPTLAGVYKPTIDGTYTNAGGLVRDTGIGGIDEGLAVEFLFDGVSIWVKNTYRLPQAKNKIQTFESGLYDNESQVNYRGDLYESVDIISTGETPYNSDKWIPLVETSGISPQFDSPAVTVEARKFSRYIKSIRLIQGFDPSVLYFIRWVRYKNEGYTGIMIQLQSLPAGANEFAAQVENISVSVGIPVRMTDAGRIVEIELSKYAPASFTLNGVIYQDSLLNNFAFGEKTYPPMLDLKGIATTTTTPSIERRNKVYYPSQNGIYANFNNLEVWNEGCYFKYDYLTQKWSKITTDAGDFTTNLSLSPTPAVGNDLRKWIHSIKLVEGFDFNTRYFIKRIAYKSDGESGIYLQIQSLPVGAFEFEWRIQPFDLIKGDPILLHDTARGRKVVLTMSYDAPSTFNKTVVNWQDSELSKKAFYDQSWNIPRREIKTTRITVPNNADYAIRTLVGSLRSSANYYNRYIVEVPNGVYFEYDIRTVSYVDIEGQSAEGVIITLDGNSTKIAPSDPTIGDGGVPINTIASEFKHIFWHVSTSEIRNVTLEVKSVKYAIHQDAPGAYEAFGRNIIFKQNGSVVRLLGIGGWANQKQIYKDCYFDNLEGTQAIGWHNWNNQAAPSIGEFINCRSKYIFLNATELNSTKADIIRLVNCKQDFDTLGGIVFSVEPQDSTPPLDVPYCMKLFLENTNMAISEVNRPNYKVF